MPTSAISVARAAIRTDAAMKGVVAAVARAEQLGIQINVAVVDPSGTLMAFLRMPSAPLHSIAIAIDKGYTAASFRLPTSRWTEVLETHSAAVRSGLVVQPRFIAFGGGIPIFEGGSVVGAIGVSGGSEEQDELCAQAGLNALNLE